MNNLQRLLAPAGIFFLVVTLAGCASRPEEGIKLAQKAKDEAEREQAADFAPADWKSAQKAWDDAQAALEKQSYSEAASLLTTSRSRFEKARTIAKAKREQARNELSLLQTAVNRRLGVLRNGLESGAIPAKTLRALRDDFQKVEVAVETFNTEMLNDQLLQAKSDGQKAMEELQKLEKQVAALDKRLIY
jgi:hypothetical protein